MMGISAHGTGISVQVQKSGFTIAGQTPAMHESCRAVRQDCMVHVCQSGSMQPAVLGTKSCTPKPAAFQADPGSAGCLAGGAASGAGGPQARHLPPSRCLRSCPGLVSGAWFWVVLHTAECAWPLRLAIEAQRLAIVILALHCWTACLHAHQVGRESANVWQELSGSPDLEAGLPSCHVLRSCQPCARAAWQRDPKASWG